MIDTEPLMTAKQREYADFYFPKDVTGRRPQSIMGQARFMEEVFKQLVQCRADIEKLTRANRKIMEYLDEHSNERDT
jgi:hypothetical protein